MSVKIIGCTDKDIDFACENCGIRNTKIKACKRLNFEMGIVVNRTTSLLMSNKLIIK